MREIVLVLLIGLLLIGCAKEGEIRKGEPFTLKMGEHARFQDIAIKFVDVPNDSRCPSDVVCVSAGEATVIVEVLRKSGMTQYALTKPSSPIVEISPYILSFEDLKPYPVSTREISKAKYEVVLRIG